MSASKVTGDLLGVMAAILKAGLLHAQQPHSATSLLQQVQAAGSAGEDAVRPLQHELPR